jgi:hypothetical protein
MNGSPANPDRLYASQSNGWFGQLIQRSDDGGQTWTPVDNTFVYEGDPGTDQYYDGTQQCAGTRFTLASVLLAPFFCFPVFLFYRMQKLIALDDNTSPGSLTAVQGNALRYCMPPPHEPSVFQEGNRSSIHNAFTLE